MSAEYGHSSVPDRHNIDMPTVRKLYDAASSVQELNLVAESLSVREQAASLSSRAVIEGLQPDDAEGNSLQAVSSGEPEDWNSLEDVQRAQRVASRHTSASGGAGPWEQNGDSEATPLLPRGVIETEESSSTHQEPLTVSKAVSYIPSVLLGVLLNILDGLSYGMILFPIANPVYVGLESVGLAMFYVATIVSQLVYSLGASDFPACIGSEMIEIIPFFHAIASSIASRLQYSTKEEVLATTITAYALSSIVTGLVFFLLGWLRLGALVGFFPRHILVGCIGGVGWFLAATGIEVGSRLESSLTYDWSTLVYLFSPAVLVKWGSCLSLAVVLMFVERRLSSPLMIPGILIATFIGFHAVVAAVPGLSLDDARAAGWVFPAQPAGEPWYYFYELYRFNLVHWGPIVETLPVMLALTFFGIIHVPINIPALAAATKNDNINVNRELIAHGISNTISGMMGGIQNYLVYTNSVMFIKSGADRPAAGLMLAGATFAVMIAGPVIIGYIPVIVVASLIFMMGFDLMAEALVDTWKTVDTQEYLTIVAIVVTMGGYDFVVGIVVGIILACLFFVITSARTDPVRSRLTGETAHSTVRRHPLLQHFLSRVGKQIYILKLQGSLFFGTNVRIERSVREIVEEYPGIKYLLVDLDAVTDIDFCTADTFARLKRLLDAKGIRLILSGASQRGDKIRGLRAVDLVQDHDRDKFDPLRVRVFPNLNTALEACENELVETYYRHRASMARTSGAPPPMFRAVPTQRAKSGIASVASSVNPSLIAATPRANTLRVAAENYAVEDMRTVAKWNRLQQPLALLMAVADGVSDRNEDFWFRVSHFFDYHEVAGGTEITQLGFVLVESGILHVEYISGYYETVLAGTAYGELTFFGRAPPQGISKVTTESPAAVWIMTAKQYAKMCESEQGDELGRELLQLGFHVALERFIALTQFIKTSA